MILVVLRNFWRHWLRIWAHSLKIANGKFNMADQNANNYRIWMIRLVLFLTVLDIFNDKSVNSTCNPTILSTFRKKPCHKLKPSFWTSKNTFFTRNALRAYSKFFRKCYGVRNLDTLVQMLPHIGEDLRTL